jgi:hypothetical protein
VYIAPLINPSTFIKSTESALPDMKKSYLESKNNTSYLEVIEQDPNEE